jgi:UDP-glucose 4-epimerase
LARADDLGQYYRIPADARDLNYSSFFSEGKKEVSGMDDYNSHNTRLLNVEEMMDLLLQLACVRELIGSRPAVAA